jgi:hypothetical protein
MPVTPVDTALSVGQRIGRYFSLVSLVPSLFLVSWIYVLLLSGAPAGKPSLAHIRAEFTAHWSVTTAIGLVIASFAVAIVLHPLQFATTQLLEGYWGTTPLGVAAMKIRIVHHRKRRRELRRRAGHNRRALEAGSLKVHPEWSQDNKKELAAHISDFMRYERADQLLLHLVAEQEAYSRGDRYPVDDSRILPTQLGNALRRLEDSAGKQYGLDAITIVPHLHLVAPDRHLDYLKDAREDMDSAIRICTVGLLATVLTVAFLLTDGNWLLWTLLPYAVSYFAYKGAVSAARNYGGVIASVIDLDRFLLYDRLGLNPPRDSAEERRTNAKLMRLLTGETTTLPYRPKDSTLPTQN